MQFDIAPYALPAGQLPRSTPSLASDLLRQILDVQRQQLDLMKANQNALTAMAEAQSQARKRSWFDRWQDEFPDLPENCRRALNQPAVRRAKSEVEAIRSSRRWHGTNVRRKYVRRN